jgi:hypothetical protein
VPLVDEPSLESLELLVLDVPELELSMSPGPPPGGGPPGGGPPAPPGPMDFRSASSDLTSLASVLELLSVESVVEVELEPVVLLELLVPLALLEDPRSERSLSRSFWTVAIGLVVDEEEDVSLLVELLLPEVDELEPLESCERKEARLEDTGIELVVLSAVPVVDVEPDVVFDDVDAAWLLPVEFIFCSSCRSMLC